MCVNEWYGGRRSDTEGEGVTQREKERHIGRRSDTEGDRATQRENERQRERVE